MKVSEVVIVALQNIKENVTVGGGLENGPKKCFVSYGRPLFGPISSAYP